MDMERDDLWDRDPDYIDSVYAEALCDASDGRWDDATEL